MDCLSGPLPGDRAGSAHAMRLSNGLKLCRNSIDYMIGGALIAPAERKGEFAPTCGAKLY